MNTLSNSINNLCLWLLGLLAIVVSSGCGKDTPTFSLLPEGDTFKQNNMIFNNQLDILFVIDNSGSMDPYQQNLTTNFSSFINNFRNKGYDFKIAVTTSHAYLANTAHLNNQAYARFRDGTDQTSHTGVFVILPSTPNLTNTFMINALQGSSGSGDERAFSSFREALNSPLNAGFLRPQSFLAIIILSDEDDFSGDGRCQGCGSSHNYGASTLDSVNTYVSYLDQLTRTTGVYRRYNVSNISVIDQACYQQNQSTGSIIGQRYLQLTQATDGVSGSICDTSFANSLNAIQSKIAELSTQFFLERVPVMGTIVVKVNGVLIPESSTNGWTYNASANSIVFHGSAVPAQGAIVQINYTPTTIKN